MKKFTAILLVLTLIVCLAGCRTKPADDTTAGTDPANTAPSSQPTDTTQTGTPQTAENGASQILSAIWDNYPEDARFAVYGGMMEAPVDSAPGNLDLTNGDEIASKYLLPVDLLAQVEEGASLVHLMNSNLFTAAVFRLKTETNAEAFAKTLRENIQKNQWICGQPDKLLIAQPEGDYLLVAFGSEDAMGTFAATFSQSFTGAKTFYDEAVVA